MANRVIIQHPDGDFTDGDTGQRVDRRDIDDDDRVISKEELDRQEAGNLQAAAGQVAPSAFDQQAGVAAGGIPQAPEQGIGKADIGLKLLEILGGVGGGIARSRAIGKANKQTAANQAKANLLSVLSGGRGGGVAQVQPELGIGGNILDALGGIGKAGGGLLGQSRSMEQEKFENALNIFGAEQTEEKTEIDRIRAETAETRADTAAARATLAEEKITIEMRHAAEDIGYYTHATGGTLEDSDAAVIASFGKIPALMHLARGDWHKRNDAKDKDKFSRLRQKNREKLAEAGEDRKVTAARAGEISRQVAPVKDSFKDQVILAEGGSLPAYADMFAEHYSNIAIVFARRDKPLEPHEMATIANELRAGYTAGRVALMKQLEKRGGLSNQARMTLADVVAMGRKADQLKEMMDKAILTGPIFGRIPAVQLLVPDDAVFDAYGEAFALELASVLNRGRPSEKDFQAARKIVPARDDLQEVRDKKLAAIKMMLRMRGEGIESEFQPILTVRGSDEKGFTIIEDIDRREQKVIDEGEDGGGEGKPGDIPFIEVE